MQYLFNFLSKEAASQLAELALADGANIVADKIFNGLVEGRVSKQLKEICLMDQVYVKAEDGDLLYHMHCVAFSTHPKSRRNF